MTPLLSRPLPPLRTTSCHSTPNSPLVNQMAPFRDHSSCPAAPPPPGASDVGGHARSTLGAASPEVTDARGPRSAGGPGAAAAYRQPKGVWLLLALGAAWSGALVVAALVWATPSSAGCVSVQGSVHLVCTTLEQTPLGATGKGPLGGRCSGIADRGRGRRAPPAGSPRPTGAGVPRRIGGRGALRRRPARRLDDRSTARTCGRARRRGLCVQRACALSCRRPAGRTVPLLGERPLRPGPPT